MGEQALPRVLAICLDGYEESVGRRLMDQGHMPALHALSERSARFWLDHGPALRTGLAGENVATGLSPEDADRWAAVHFDPASYSVRQEGTAIKPFTAALGSRAVVFDPPYFDLARAPGTRGIVAWGAHDPGVAGMANPRELLNQSMSRFGKYPAQGWIYRTPWNSPAATKEMGDRLSEGVRTRTRVARWLYGERLPDWDLALVTVSEAHSAIESLWHGIDRSHPLHDCPSAPAAAEGIRSVYFAIDDLVGELAGAFPDAVTVVFSMHGMGPNRSDAASMLLLAELLYRRAFKRAYFDRRGKTSAALKGQATMPESESWGGWVNAGFPAAVRASSQRRVAPLLTPTPVKRILKRMLDRPTVKQSPPLASSVDWMPATRYQPHWHRMPAFALPSFYDGRLRINLRGRERAGMIDLGQYHAFRDGLVAMLGECRDPISGETVVEEVEYPAGTDPMGLGPTEADLVILWRGAPMGLVHPEHGQIGPVPYRRTGGHTGARGFAFIRGAGIQPGEHGTRSAFDVVPTLVDLLGRHSLQGLSGTSLLGGRRTAA
jgi:predicted AlkP superfamily phosphohydrolase/phosphomutase